VVIYLPRVGDQHVTIYAHRVAALSSIVAPSMVGMARPMPSYFPKMGRRKMVAVTYRARTTVCVQGLLDQFMLLTHGWAFWGGLRLLVASD
jgi:hypothetical protein